MRTLQFRDLRHPDKSFFGRRVVPCVRVRVCVCVCFQKWPRGTFAGVCEIKRV